MALTTQQLDDLHAVLNNIVHKDVLSTMDHYCVMFFLNSLTAWGNEIGDADWQIRLTISEVLTNVACMGMGLYSYRLVCASRAQCGIMVLKNYLK